MKLHPAGLFVTLLTSWLYMAGIYDSTNAWYHIIRLFFKANTSSRYFFLFLSGGGGVWRVELMGRIWGEEGFNDRISMSIFTVMVHDSPATSWHKINAMTLKVYFIGVSHAQTELKTTWQNSLNDYDHFRESTGNFPICQGDKTRLCRNMVSNYWGFFWYANSVGARHWTVPLV